MSNILVEHLQQLHEMMKPHKQANIFKWLLENGKEYSFHPIPARQQRYLARRLGSPLFTPKQCYYNAQMLIVSGQKGTYKYCEGYATTQDFEFPFEHSWLLYHGRVVDPSWRDGKNYFGVTIPKEFVRRSLLDTEIAQSILFPFIKSEISGVEIHGLRGFEGKYPCPHCGKKTPRWQGRNRVHVNFCKHCGGSLSQPIFKKQHNNDTSRKGGI